MTDILWPMSYLTLMTIALLDSFVGFTNFFNYFLTSGVYWWFKDWESPVEHVLPESFYVLGVDIYLDKSILLLLYWDLSTLGAGSF